MDIAPSTFEITYFFQKDVREATEPADLDEKRHVIMSRATTVTRAINKLIRELKGEAKIDNAKEVVILEAKVVPGV